MNERTLNKMMKEYVSEAMKEVEKDISAAIRYANNELFEEADKMYKSFIKQFYNYKTTSYIRHWEGVPGTKEGQNLYLGEYIKKHNGWHPTLNIRFPEDIGYSNNMNGGYQHDTPDDVLTYVAHGYRFPYQFKWRGTYLGKYFEYSGTMKDAFDEFDNRFDDLAKNIANDYLRKIHII